MKLILIVYSNGKTIFSHVVSDYNYIVNSDFKGLLKTLIWSANLDKQKYKRFVLSVASDDSSFVKTKHKSFNLMKNVDIMTIQEYKYLSDFNYNLKSIDDYKINKADVKFIKTIMQVNKTLSLDSVICYDSDSDAYEKDYDVSMVDNKLREMKPVIKLSKFDSLNGNRDKKIKVDKKHVYKKEKNSGQNDDGKSQMLNNNSLAKMNDDEFRLSTLKFGEPLCQSTKHATMKDSNIENINNENISDEMKLVSLTEVILSNCINQKMDGKIVCFHKSINKTTINNCVDLISNAFLTIGKFKIQNDIAILDNPFVYAYGDYLWNRSLIPDRTSRIGLNDFMMLEFTGFQFRPYFK